MKYKSLLVAAAVAGLLAAGGGQAAQAQGYGWGMMGGYGPGAHGHMGGYGPGYSGRAGYGPGWMHRNWRGYGPRSGYGYGCPGLDGWSLSMKRKNILIATAVAAVLGAGVFAASSHAQSYGPGWGMMDGYGPGWMHGSGRGYGPGWMMQGGGTPPCWGYSGASGDTIALNLTVDQVKNQLDRWIERQGSARLKAGDVKEKDADTIQADVVTKDNSLVQRFEINRHTGFWRQSES